MIKRGFNHQGPSRLVGRNHHPLNRKVIKLKGKRSMARYITQSHNHERRGKVLTKDPRMSLLLSPKSHSKTLKVGRVGHQSPHRQRVRHVNRNFNRNSTDLRNTGTAQTGINSSSNRFIWQRAINLVFNRPNKRPQEKHITNVTRNTPGRLITPGPHPQSREATATRHRPGTTR